MAPSAPLVVRGRRRKPALRPLTTGSYQPPAPPEPDEPSLLRSLVTYAVPVLVVAVLAARWFVPGRFFVSSATPPLVLDNLRAELWSAWSHQLSGGGSSSFPMARALDAGALAFGDWAGISGPAVQMLTAMAVAAYACGAVTFLARNVVGPVAAAFAGVLAVVNPYVLAMLPDTRPLVVVGLAASLAALLWGAGGGRSVAPIALVVAVVPASMLAVEPSVVAGLGVWSAACVAVVVVAQGRAGGMRLLRLALWAVPLVALTQLWWLVPAVQALGGFREGVELQAAGLATPLVAAFAVPLVALGGAAVLDRWLRQAGRARRSGARRWRALRVEALALAAVVGVLALPLPLWTGSVAQGSSVEVPAGWTSVAAAVNASGSEGKVLVLPLAPSDGRVTTAWGYSGADEVPRQLFDRPVLQRSSDDLFRLPPRLDAHLRSATRLLAAATPKPGPAAADGRDTAGDRAAAGSRVTAGSAAEGSATSGPAAAEEAARLLDQLGVSHVVVRHDLARGTDPRSAETVAGLPGWRPVGRFDVATVVERVRPAPLVAAVAGGPDGTAPTVTWARRDPAHYAVTVTAVDGDFVLTLAETFGPGWQLRGLPPSWSADHGVVDGYANGWQIDGEGWATLQLMHRPSEVARAAALVSAGTVAAVALLSVTRMARRRLSEPPEQP